MADSYNALDELSKKHAESTQKRIRAIGHVDGQGDDATLLIPIKLRDLSQARNGTGARHAKGFGLTVRFEHNGHEFSLRSGWMTITSTD